MDTLVMRNFLLERVGVNARPNGLSTFHTHKTARKTRLCPSFLEILIVDLLVAVINSLLRSRIYKMNDMRSVPCALSLEEAKIRIGLFIPTGASLAIITAKADTWSCFILQFPTISIGCQFLPKRTNSR